MNNLPSFVTAITADAIALLLNQIPTATASQLLGTAYQSWQYKRAKEAHDILLNEISKGQRLSNDVDPNTFFGLLHRYLNATKQGAARANLRLMAQVLRGSLETDCPFNPDELASNAELVASLSRNEIKLLGSFWQANLEDSSMAMINNSIAPREAMVRERSCMQKLIPTIYANEEAFYAAAAALTRTGLIVAKSGYGKIIYDVTSRLETLVKLCDLESALSPNED